MSRPNAAVAAAASGRVSTSRSTTEKEAKALATELASLLNKKDPWHQDVVFARENLRRHCLALIFIGTDANAAVNARKRLASLNVLFLSTSHNVIHHFRQRLSAIDAALSGKAGDKGTAAGKRKDERSSKANANGPTPGQRRKLLHSFRDFLAQEETFWRDLLIRIVGVFDVKEARASLRLLQIGLGDWEPDAALVNDAQLHASALGLCHKTLICFGDIARYRELYSDKAGPSQSSKQKQAGKQGSKESIAGKTFARAYEAYHQARLLVPDDGNPSNQLAVLAGYQGDQLSCIYHYYRALCVKKAFTTATQNLTATMTKILALCEAEDNTRRNRRAIGSKPGSYAELDAEVTKFDAKDPAEALNDFKKMFIRLHAMLFQAAQLDKLPNQFQLVTKTVAICIAKRVLPSDVIVKTVVTSLGAWWHARMYRNTARPGSEDVNVDNSSLEASTLMHALAIVSEMLTIAASELSTVQASKIRADSASAAESERNMIIAQNISAVLRRMLPALRIASMWLLSNSDYLARYDVTTARYKPDDPTIPHAVCAAARSFWTTYIQFVNAAQTAFGSVTLPVSTVDIVLEEDVDMLGFAPLRRRMKEVSAAKVTQGVQESATLALDKVSNLHPNEEQIYRLGDLFADARLMAQSETCPVIIERGAFAIRKKQLNPASQPWSPAKMVPALPASPNAVPLVDEELDEFANPAGLDDLEDMYSDGNDYDGTEDDVLDLAMRVATGETSHAQTGAVGRDEQKGDEDDDEDDDDEVVYAPKAGLIGDRRPPSNSPRLATAAPQGGSTSSAAPGTPTSRTASDLLLQVLQGSSLDFNGSNALKGDSTGSATVGEFTGGSAFGGRSIWSSGSGAAQASTVQSESKRPGSRHQAGGSGLSSQAETLFNSMPNQQTGSSNRSSPNMTGASAFDPFGQDSMWGNKANAAVTTGAQIPLQADIWNAAPMQQVAQSPRAPPGLPSKLNHHPYHRQQG